MYNKVFGRRLRLYFTGIFTIINNKCCYLFSHCFNCCCCFIKQYAAQDNSSLTYQCKITDHLTALLTPERCRHVCLNVSFDLDAFWMKRQHCGRGILVAQDIIKKLIQHTFELLIGSCKDLKLLYSTFITDTWKPFPLIIIFL